MIIISGASRGIGNYLLNFFLKYNYCKVDIRDYEKVKKTIDPIILKSKNLILINCAGINYNSFAHKSDPQKWKDVIETNLLGTYNLIRCVLPKMREIKNGRIINFSSVLAIKGTPGTSAYASSKSALNGLVKSIAVENAKKNITINNINLGYSKIGIIREVPEKYKQKIMDQIPTGKLCSPSEIYSTVEYLINTSYITGESININGGLV